MSKLKEIIKKSAARDDDVFVVFSGKDKEFLKNMNDEDFDLWTKQLGITRRSSEYEELKGIINIKEKNE